MHNILLAVLRPDRQHQQASRLQLVEQRLRYLLGHGADVDCIVRGALCVAHAPISTDHLDAAIVELLTVAFAQIDARELAKILHVLDTIDRRATIGLIFAQLVKCGAQVATPAPYVENVRTRTQLRLEALHDIGVQVRCTDDHIVLNGQRTIVIGRSLGSLGNELGPVDDLHDIGDSLRVNEAILGQPLDQRGKLGLALALIDYLLLLLLLLLMTSTPLLL